MTERADLPPCDLVMKGGITSGVVYPGAVQDLAGDYRFANVGGASAGAIAAVVTAAAEYGARRGRGGGFHVLDEVVADLTKTGFLEGLFQATPPTRPLLDAALRGLREGAPAWRRTLGIAGALLGSAKRWVALAAVAAVAALVAAVLLARALPPALAVVVLAVAALVGVLAVLVVTFFVGRRAAGRLHDALRAHGFGMCPGTPQPGYPGPALTEWLHGKVQAAAGLELTQPLTFAMLAEEDVRLEVMTTDLSYARPLRLPLSDEDEYFFRPADFEALFGADIARAMLPGGRAYEGADPYEAFPREALPVVVAARMSLSFPVLLSAVPLHTMHPDYEARLARGEDPMILNWFSDGGIASNFPIHFFDSWLPRHPTFGLDLLPASARPDEGAVDLLGTWDRMPAPRWADVDRIGTFVAQLRDVAQNWRDNLQAGLPGYRDRICAVRLQPAEGGLNLNMSPETISALVERGRSAGARIRADFDWDAHRWTRYLTLMQQLQLNFGDVTPRFEPFARMLAETGPGTVAFARGHDLAWCAGAAGATGALLEAATAWPVSFAQGGGVEPRPTPALRITPKT